MHSYTLYTHSNTLYTLIHSYTLIYTHIHSYTLIHTIDDEGGGLEMTLGTGLEYRAVPAPYPTIKEGVEGVDEEGVEADK